MSVWRLLAFLLLGAALVILGVKDSNMFRRSRRNRRESLEEVLDADRE